MDERKQHFAEMMRRAKAIVRKHLDAEGEIPPKPKLLPPEFAGDKPWQECVENDHKWSKPSPKRTGAGYFHPYCTVCGVGGKIKKIGDAQ